MAEAEDHVHAALIARFFEAFTKLDGEAMAACYHAEVRYSDPVFPSLQGERAGLMWCMLTSRASDLVVVASGIEADDDAGKAHWEADYTFSKSGNAVHNIMNDTFQFKEGLIVKHTSSFNFPVWAKQALGCMGAIFGSFGFLQTKVRTGAAEQLQRYCDKRIAGAAADVVSEGGAAAGAAAMPLIVERAEESDVLFIADAMLFAERGAWDYGFWDYMISEPLDAAARLRVLAAIATTGTSSPFHWSRFWVARLESGGAAVAAACGYRSAVCSVEDCVPALRSALAIEGVDAEAIESIVHRADFLAACYPAAADYSNSWCIEAVYTAPSARGKGASLAVIKAVAHDYERMGDVPIINIAAYVGNTAAYRLYEKAGYVAVPGDSDSDACEAALRVTRGFRIFSKAAPPPQQ
jgi:GNAT superfamily N-acetyltransferase